MTKPLSMPESTTRAVQKAEQAGNSAVDFDRLVSAVIKQESAGNPKAVSRVGARGLMQLMPATAKEVAKELGIEEYSLEDPETNKRLGSYYLQKQLKTFNDLPLALAAYNAGPGRVKDWIRRYGASWDAIAQGIRNRDPKHETLGYVTKVLKNYQQGA